MATQLLNPLIAPISFGEISYASGSSSEDSSRIIRARRSHRSSSDEAPVLSDDGIVEEDLRAGGPNLCAAPCLKILKVPRGNPTFEALDDPSNEFTDGILEVARQQHLRVDQIDFCGRKPVFEPNQTPKLTVLMYATRKEPLQRGHWANVVRKVLDYLAGRSVTGVVVEIIDPTFDRKPNIFPCTSSRDAIFHVWETLGPKIVGDISLSGVNTLGCYRVGLSDDRRECPVTILVGVQHRYKRDWKALREDILSILEAANLASVGLLIRYDKVVLSMGGDPDEAPRSAQDYSEDIRPGHTFAPHNMRHGYGTFGGWLELKNPKTEEWLPVGLTCCHCIFAPHEDIPFEMRQSVAKWKADGIPLGDAHAMESLIMNAPSRGNVRNRIEELGKKISNYTNDPTYRSVHEAKAEGVEVPRSQLSEYETLKICIASYNEDRDRLKGMLDHGHYVFGKVLAASGLKTQFLETTSTSNPQSLPSVVDWALIMPNKRPGKNEVPSNAELKCTKLLRFALGAIPAESSLFKIGSSTGVTMGEYGGLKECMVATAMVDGQERAVKTWEHTLVGSAVGLKGALVAPGDSGSLVIQENGFVRGLLFGGTNSQDRGFFTHSKDLLTSIEKTTGVHEIRIFGQDD